MNKYALKTIAVTVLLASSLAVAQNNNRKERRERPQRPQISDADFQKIQECHAQYNLEFPPQRGQGEEKPSQDTMDKVRACLKAQNVEMPEPRHHEHGRGGGPRFEQQDSSTSSVSSANSSRESSAQ